MCPLLCSQCALSCVHSVPSPALSYCVCAVISANYRSDAPERHRSCCAKPLSFVGGGRVLLVAALIAATASFSLDGAGGKGRPFAKASRSMLQISCAPTYSSKSALSRCCKKPCRWPMSVGLQELVPAGGRRGSARVAHLAGGATRPPQRLRAAARPFPNAGFFGCFAKQPAFISRPPRRHPFRPPLRPKPLAPATGAPPRGSARPLSGREVRPLGAPAVAGAAT